MNMDDISLQLVKYKVSKLQLTIPTIKEPYLVETSFITTFSIEKEYGNYYFPYFQMSITVPSYIYRAMKKNSDDLYAYLDLQKAYFKKRDNSIENPVFSSCVKDTFYIFMEDSTPDMNEEQSKAIEQASGTYNKGSSLNSTTSINILLYNKAYLFNSKTVVNAILTSATLIEGLTYVLNKAKIKKVLISPPDTYKTYSEFIITPLTTLEQIERICNEYGMHKNGTLIFFDLDTAYIVDKTPKCTAYENNEFKITHLLSSETNSGTQKKGCYRCTADKYNVINLEEDNVQFQALGEVNNQLYGKSFTTIDSATGKVTTTESKAKSAKDSTSSSRVLIQNTGDTTSTALANSLKEDSKIAILGFSYVDLDMLTPNKQFIITIDDSKLKKYNGKYRITKMLATFEKEGKYFIPQIVAEFKG